ncbi:MAG: hypothetical protein Q9213_000084 [Squamulea squamosa]
MPNEDTPGLSIQKRLRTLAFPRSGSGSPGKATVQDVFDGDRDDNFKLNYVVQLGKDRPPKDRIETLVTAANELHRCSSTTILAILVAAEDLFDDTADLQSQKAGFSFLTKAAAIVDSDETTRAKLFECISKPADPLCLADKVKALDKLTRRGTKVSSFQPHVTDLVGELLSNCFVAADRSRSEKRSKTSKSDEEHNLGTVWAMLNNLMTHVHSLDAVHSSQLLTRLTTICKKTTAGYDLNRAVAAISAFAVSAKVPNENLDPLINVLCHTCYAREKCRDTAQSCLDNVFSASDRSLAMEVLLRNLSQISDDPASIKELRGSLLQLQHIYGTNGIGANPGPPLAELVQALKDSATVDHGDQIQNQATLTMSLQAVASVVGNDLITQSLIESDWTCMEGIVDVVAKAAGPIPAGNISYDDITPASPIFLFARSVEVDNTAVTKEMIGPLQDICRVLAGIYPQLTLTKRTVVVNLLLFLSNVVEPSALDVVIDYMEDCRIVFPPDENWLLHLALLTDRGFLNTSKHSLYRLRLLDLMSHVFSSLSTDPKSASMFGQQFATLLKRAVIGSSLAAIDQLAELACRFLRDASMPTFDLLLADLVDLAIQKRYFDLTESSSTLPENQANPTCIRLAESFLECLPDQAEKIRKIFASLVAIAKTATASTTVRLDAIKLLMRLRSKSDGSLQVVEMSDTQGLGAALAKAQPPLHQSSGSGESNRASSIEETLQCRSVGSASLRDFGGEDARSRPQSTSEVQAQTSSGWPTDSLDIRPTASTKSSTIDLTIWLELILDLLETCNDWEIYSYILLHLPSQLGNVSLFVKNIPHIEKLHDLLVHQLQKGKFLEPPMNTDLRKGHVAVCLYQTLTVLVAYSGWFLPQKMAETVQTFLFGISQWNQTIKCCIHALALCCHELPRAIDKCLSLILTKMSQIITQSHFAIDILEFLTRLSRLPAAYHSIGDEPLRTIFGICIRHLHHSRDLRQIAADSANLGSTNSSKRCSNVSGNGGVPSDSSQTASTDKELPEYVYALAYHVITHWFLAIPIKDRSKHVGWIAKNLAWKDKYGEENVEEQSQVTLDLMHRTAYLDLGETMRASVPADAEENMIKKMYLIGMSIVTIETNSKTGLTYITKRQASGTTNATYQPCTAPLPAHHVIAPDQATTATAASTPLIYPQHVLLQMSSTISPMPIPEQPIVLPDDGTPEKAISQIDRIATVDSYKAGVIYVASKQVEEKEILANTAGSEVFDTFLAGLGTKVPLQGATFNTCGLDKVSNMDGTHTVAWRDRVAEIVFHVPIMMPNLEHDPQCTNKKMHTGNDYVNIIFNESGLPFRFNTFPSALNFVNIVITPEKVGARQPPSRASDKDGSKASETCYFFTIQVLCAPFLPEISPAATPKVVSATALPGYVRQLALNAHLFSVVWSERAQGQELVSSWRSRLREIRKLRERYANTGNSANVGYPEMGTAEDRGGAKSYVEGDEWRGTLAMGGMAEQGQFLMSLDFTRWT